MALKSSIRGLRGAGEEQWRGEIGWLGTSTGVFDNLPGDYSKVGLVVPSRGALGPKMQKALQDMGILVEEIAHAGF